MCTLLSWIFSTTCYTTVWFSLKMVKLNKIKNVLSINTSKIVPTFMYTELFNKYHYIPPNQPHFKFENHLFPQFYANINLPESCHEYLSVFLQMLPQFRIHCFSLALTWYFQTCSFAIKFSKLLLKLFPKILSHYSHIAYKNSSFLRIIHSWFDVLPTILGLFFATLLSHPEWPMILWVHHVVSLPLQGILLLLFCYLNIIPYSSNFWIMSYSLWNFPESHICSFYLFYSAI